MRDRLLRGANLTPPAPLPGRLRWAIATLALCFATAGGWLLVAPSTAAAAAARLTGTAGEEQLRLEIAGRLVPRGVAEIRVAAGLDATVRAVGVDGRSPGAIRWRAAGTVPTPNGPGAVRLTVGERPAIIAAAADGFRSTLLTLRPIPAPVVAEFLTTVESPSGAISPALSPTVVSAEPADRVRIKITPSRPAEMRLVVPPDGPTARRNGDGWTLAALPPGDWPVGVVLTSRERPFVSAPAGDAASVRPLFTLRVKADAPPRVDLTLPAEGATVTPDGSLPVAARAEDDRSGLRIEAMVDGRAALTAEAGEKLAVALDGSITAPADVPVGGDFVVLAAANDSSGRRTETEPRRVRVVSEEEKRAALESAVPPIADALSRAARDAEDLANRLAAGGAVEPAEIRRRLDRLDATFAAPVRSLIAEARANTVPPGPRLTAAEREQRDGLPAAIVTADQLRTALREGRTDGAGAAERFAERLAESADRLRKAIAAADGTATSDALKAEQIALTERTVAAVGGAEAPANLTDEQRRIAAALGALRDGPAAGALRAAARELTAGRPAEAVVRQREALAVWDESLEKAASGGSSPARTRAAITALASRQRAAAAALQTLIDDGLVGRRALRELRRMGDEEEAVVAELNELITATDPATGAALRASAEDAGAVVVGVTDRRSAEELFPLAERAAARLEALASAAQAAAPEASAADPPSPPEGDPTDGDSPDLTTLIGWQRFLRERTLSDSPDLPALAGEQRSLAALLPSEAPVGVAATEAADRLDEGDSFAAADRQQATLQLLESMIEEAKSAAGASASPTDADAGTLPDAGTSAATAPDADAAGAEGSTAGAGGSSTGKGSTGTGLLPAGVADGPTFPWGRLPPRLRERLADAADLSAAPGFADLTARYRSLLGESIALPPLPSSTPDSSP
ncbi:hypothetical protein LzC2_08460 [Planctomycetes bacterium LzC2]|uniref:DUF4175 family protein n=1 Tax=Alienimonas chondri TaxID=2681879 RepID=A0ABX1VBI5_9PLAN|nr:hypothetical protein [Alienimonas chondri]